MITNPQGADYDKMVNLALELLMDYEIYDFPLNLKSLTKKLNIKLKKYSELNSVDFEALVEKSPLGTTTMEKYTNYHMEYQLWYNDIDNSVERNRFTIAHEICHVVNEDFEKPITENDEKLCDYFAKCLLAPQCLIISRNELDINTIVTKYKVSKMVAENWLYAIIALLRASLSCSLSSISNSTFIFSPSNCYVDLIRICVGKCTGIAYTT